MASSDEIPRSSIIDSRVARLSEEMRDKVWEVIGGGDRGGIIVREGPELNSTQAKQLLSTAALVKEIASVGDRLEYEILDGDGPVGGWVSVKTHNAYLLTKVEESDEQVQKRIEILIRRLAMLPPELRKIDIKRSLDLTEQLYRHQGAMMKSDCKLWRQTALQSQARQDDAYPGFPAFDRVLASLFSDRSLQPLRRVFPRPPRGDSDECRFAPSLDAVHGLLPDAHAVAYFMSRKAYSIGLTDIDYSLYGAVHYGPQASGSIACGDSEGQTVATNHGGSTMAVLYDAAVYLTRLSVSGAAMPTKLSCTLSKPCPLCSTLEIVAAFTEMQSQTQFCSVKVKLCKDDVLIAVLDVDLTWNPSRAIVRQPLGTFPTKRDIVCPCIDWVPHELALAHAPYNWGYNYSDGTGWDARGYRKAALDETADMKWPQRCAPRRDLRMIRTMQRSGRPPHERANRPAAGGKFRRDLAYAAGLAPAAMSFTKWFDSNETRFDGMVKFGPQASDAWFLEENATVEEAAPEMSLVAHYGMVLAVMDEFAAHLPRLSPGVMTTTWRFDAEILRMIPIGHEMQIRTWLTTRKSSIDHPQAVLVKADIRDGSEIQDDICVRADITLFGTL
mmetsp:Transcript_132349/g.294996  ORF Transcript_132349/g.294996 Transcript_132349/m.294996 type:complete len:614 (+) Transcript_132349:53-1894(+)